jgi:uncharacterized membrane protein
MSAGEVQRDERTLAVENAGYRWSYFLLSFGLLLLAAYRGLARGEATGDLLALVVLGGVGNAAYQAWHRVIFRRWIVMTVVTMVIAALLAAAIMIARRAR